MTSAIASSIGGRTLTVPASRDRFVHNGVGPTTLNPDHLDIDPMFTTQWFAHDRAASQPFAIGPGASKTINFWTNFFPYFQTNQQVMMACTEQGVKASVARNWWLHASGSSSRALAWAIGTNTGISTGTTFGINAWQLVSLVYDHTVGSFGQARLYIDGILVGTSTLASAPVAPSSPEFKLGDDNLALSSPTSCAGVAQNGRYRLARLEVLPLALTQQQIIDLYAVQKEIY